MTTLGTMFKLFDGYSNPTTKIIKKTDEATNKILKASGATDKFNDKLEATGTSASVSSVGLGKFLSVAALIGGALKGMNISDEFTNTSARLNLINDGLQTQLELQDKIFTAANRSKGSYTAMASAISKMGLMASDSFGSNDELIAFTELLQKGFKVGGSSSTEQSSAMLQLTQAMGSGKLQGDEFRSIMENAPMIADAIAKYTGVSKGKLKEMSSEGLITSEIIKNAMFMASDDINAKFETMPTTFADIWNRIKNGALQAFGPIIEASSRMINSEAFNNIINGMIIGINLLSMAIGGLINFFVDNWTLIQSFLIATGIYLATTLLHGFIATGVAGMIAGIQVAAAWAVANAPMLAMIGTIAFLIYVFTEAGLTIEDIFGFIGGVIGVAVAGIWNLFLGLGELILGVINYLISPFVRFTNFLGNVFHSPISSIIYLFQSMADSVLGIIETIASALDFVFGSKMADSVAGWRLGLKDMADAAVKEYAPNENYQQIIDAEYSMKDFGLERMSYKDSYNKGSDIGKKAYNGLEGKIKEFTDSLTKKDEKDKSLDEFGTSSNPLTVQSKDKVKVDMSDEDLRYLRDIAERDYINKFSTATLAPNISVTFGDVHETADADKVAGRIKKILQEEIAMSAEGAY